MVLTKNMPIKNHKKTFIEYMVANRINFKLSNLINSSSITFLVEMKPLSYSDGNPD
jgi:hypothetical protein